MAGGAFIVLIVLSALLYGRDRMRGGNNEKERERGFRGPDNETGFIVCSGIVYIPVDCILIESPRCIDVRVPVFEQVFAQWINSLFLPRQIQIPFRVYTLVLQRIANKIYLEDYCGKKQAFREHARAHIKISTGARADVSEAVSSPVS